MRAPLFPSPSTINNDNSFTELSKWLFVAKCVLGGINIFEEKQNMRTSLSASVKRKRPRPNAAEEEPQGNCSFCGKVPAAVTVQVPVLHRKKRGATPYCLPCYYSSSAVRHDSKYVSIVDQSQLDEQLPPMQQHFSEVYVELQKELSEESARAFGKQKSDPLAMLHQAPKRKTKPPPLSQKKKAGDASDGGFLRNVPLPERLMKTQRQQARLQQAQIARMNQAAKEGPSVHQRRKPIRKSIWNLAMDPNAAKAIEESTATVSQEHVPACSCGSKDVSNFGTVTSRNQDMSKGETWGMKDRGDDVVSRFQCNKCGKMWNEEE
jgi:hypothetical protein